ncbi:MAG: NAD-dependent epimerase/dehydratase family protein [Candidatus Scalinduaceae bacterium]
MKNILITGGLGYIGGRVATYLKEEPNLNIFLTTRNKNRKLPSWTEKFTILQMNVMDVASIADCLKDRSIDVIIHLAALNELESKKDPELALEVNTKGTYKLLNTANIYNVNRFIFFSTFHVYGDISDTVITENTPTRPFHPYAITHRAAEDFVNYFNHYQSMKTLIFRMSNGYGYPMDINVDRWTLVFNDICRQAVANGEIILKSSGKQYRDFISLHDVAKAVYYFIFVIPDEWRDGIYNLGGSCAMSILDVAQEISDVYKAKYKKDIKEIRATSNKNSSIIPKPVKYSIEKIAGTGFSLKGDMIYEIERTMDLCEEFIV